MNSEEQEQAMQELFKAIDAIFKNKRVEADFHIMKALSIVRGK